jgi:hypothetical protein
MNLTYDPSNDPDAIADAEARDAETLAIGQELEDQQNALLAGKFTDAEELEKAYIELQKKFSSRQSDDADEPEAEAEEAPDEEEAELPDELQGLYSEFTEYGQLTQETAERLGEESTQIIEELFNQLQQDQPNTELSNEEVESLQSIVGGPSEYNQLVTWAAENLSEAEQNAYDNVMNSGQPEAIYFAIQALKSKYDNNVGVDGDLIQGRAPSNSRDVFRSQAELVRAMEDPRYDNDPAYRNDVLNKLERSNDLNW